MIWWLIIFLHESLQLNFLSPTYNWNWHPEFQLLMWFLTLVLILLNFLNDSNPLAFEMCFVNWNYINSSFNLTFKRSFLSHSFGVSVAQTVSICSSSEVAPTFPQLFPFTMPVMLRPCWQAIISLCFLYTVYWKNNHWKEL